MRSAILASFLHIASSASNNYHGQSDRSPETWCQYQRDRIFNTNSYKPGKGLSLKVVKLVRPIYMDLINPKEIQKCLHGKIQNQNESYNSMIWERVPKITYCGKDKLELAVYD